MSDPAKPVPLVDWVAGFMPREYMTADQRFAAGRQGLVLESPFAPRHVMVVTRTHSGSTTTRSHTRSKSFLLLLAAGGCSGGGDSPVAPPVSPPVAAAGIRVEAVGWGNARDADGVDVTLGQATVNLPWNGGVSLLGTRGQPATVMVSGVSTHCAADCLSRTVVPGSTTPDTLRFAIGCFGDLIYNEQLADGDWRMRYLDTLGNVMPVAEAPGRQIMEEWSPTGDRIVYRTNERGDRVPGNLSGWDLAVTDVPPGTRTWIATSTAGDLWPQWSPDAATILYQRWYLTGGALDSSLVYQVDSAGLAPQQLLGGPAQDQDPTWVSEGSGIAFACRRFFPLGSVCRTTPAGTGLESLTPAITDAQHLSASPSRDWISFMALDGVQAMWVVPAIGGTPTQLAPAFVTYVATWAPTSDRLIVATVEGPDNFGLRAVDRSGGNLSPNLTAFSANTGPASWSPDGSWLAVSSVDATGQHLYVLRPDGSGLRAITSGPLPHFNPHWNPSTRFIPPPPWLVFQQIAPVGAAPPSSTGSLVRESGDCVGWVGTHMGRVPCRPGIAMP